MAWDRLVRNAAVALLVSLGVAYILLSFPPDRETSGRIVDFSEFYAAGQIVRHGLGNHLYDLRVQAEFQSQVAPLHAFFLLPPFVALLFVPFTFLSYQAAYTAWTLLGVVILLAVTRLLQRNTNVLLAVRQYTHGIPSDFGLLLVLFMSFAPTMNCFLIGQNSLLMLLVYTLVFVALKQDREFAAGALLALGLFKFVLVLPFAIVMGLRRRWSFLLGFGGGGAALAAVSLLVSGPRVIVSYPQMFLSSTNRPFMGFQPEYDANIRGIVHVLGGDKIPEVATRAVIGLLSAILLWIAARIWKNSEFGLSFSVAVLAAVLTGLHAFIYDLSLLLLPISIVCGELAKCNLLLKNSALNTVLVILFIPPLHLLLLTHHVFALMGVPILVLFVSVARIAARRPPSCAAV